MAAHLLSTLSSLFKIHYQPAVEHTIKMTTLYWDRISKAQGVKLSQKGGGRSYEFPYETARGMNYAAGVAGGYLPGASGNTNDDLDTVESISATFSEKRAYTGAQFDGFYKAASHDAFSFHKGGQFARNMRHMVEDARWNLQRQMLGDGMGVLGVVVSASFSSPTTTVTLKSARVADARGMLGNARFKKNMKILPIKAAHWASSVSVSQADLIGGNAFIKVAGVSNEYDVGTAPTILLTGDYSSELAVGDVLVLANSRDSTDNGSATGATPRELNGMLSFYDDGTLSANHLGLARATYPSLKSKVNLSDAALREPTPELFQASVDELHRRLGDEHSTEGYEMISEQSVRSRYANRLGEEAKRYAQEAKGKTAVGGFSNVTMAFLGNETLVPWRTCRDFGYGQAIYHDPANMEGFWSRELGPMDDDGLTLRQVTGKDEWSVFYKLYGELICKEPWKGLRFSGLQGQWA